MINRDELSDFLSYDKNTGVFLWVKKAGNNSKLHSEAGCLNDRGYVVIGINKKIYKAHRLAWLYVYGKFPANHLDHINGIKNDNRICNLREVDHSGNSQNIRSNHKDNKSGLLGVSFKKKYNKYEAQIMINGMQKHIGLFDDPEKSYEDYVNEKRKIHPYGTI